MTEDEYNEMVAEIAILAIETEIFESAVWAIKFITEAEKTTDVEKLERIKEIINGAFKRVEQEVKL
jgi:hypothetical protein